MKIHLERIIKVGRIFKLASVCMLLTLAAFGALQLGGCQKKPAAKVEQNLSPKVSAIRVNQAPDGIHLQTGAAEFVLTRDGYLKATLVKDGKNFTLDDAANEAGQSLSVAHKEIGDISLDLAGARVSEAQGKLGKLGKQIEVVGTSASTGLEETLRLEVYDDFPGLALLSAAFRNGGQKELAIDEVTLQRRRLNATLADPAAAAHEMWSFHGSSIKWGKDEVLPIPAKFTQENVFGAPVKVGGDLGSAGGGIPVVAFWTKNVGEAIGHLETLPLVLSIPVKTLQDGRVSAGVRLPANLALKPGDIYSTPRTFLAVYAGDYYEPLSLWSNAVEREGLTKPANNEENYAVSWCGWGYEFAVTPKQMLDTIPKLKELGIHWATLDDGWFTNYGDLQPRPDAFPVDAMQKMVNDFHVQGIKVQLWWLPLAVEDGHYGYGGRKYVVSEVVKQHPDWLILDEHGKPARMARNLATLCPALPEVQSYYKQLTERFIRDWGFDGHKLDNIYSTPPCYNPAHHHKSPNDSTYAMGEVYKTIFQTTRALKPDSVTQSCPCGTPPSLAWLRYMDQAVTADPVGSVQVRRRIKMYKAILGPRSAIYGDHVELTKQTGTYTSKEQDIGDDFASTLGTGGVLGTKFTWPDYGPKFKSVYLDSKKEAHWKKWIALYNEKMLSKGNFLDLYVYGYDSPEGYAIEKDGNVFYAFFVPEKAKHSEQKVSKEMWKGEVELRGLTPGKRYRVADYVNNKDYGVAIGPTAKLNLEFAENVLLQATPEANDARR
ncbi:MAG TPA: glycoside hydrolase family 36 protein [Candidatus Dormibacteraeota bacterium]|nr:glycoside hydrolase family 36 protein [Candidatus Dormibacteraeota bacterium]